MKTVNTFSVILICKMGKNNVSEGLIYARVSVNGERKEISLKEKVSISQWNGEKQQLEGRTPQVKALNTHLDNMLFKIKEKYRSFIDKELPVTAQSIKDAYLGIQSTPKGQTLYENSKYSVGNQIFTLIERTRLHAKETKNLNKSCNYLSVELRMR